MFYGKILYIMFHKWCLLMSSSQPCFSRWVHFNLIEWDWVINTVFSDLWMLHELHIKKNIFLFPRDNDGWLFRVTLNLEKMNLINDQERPDFILTKNLEAIMKTQVELVSSWNSRSFHSISWRQLDWKI